MDYEREILVQALSWLDFWGWALVTCDAGDRTNSWCRDRTSKFPAEYEKLGARYIPAMWAEWGGYELTAAGRQAFSRAARHLESLGLIVAVRQSGTRLTHLRPTPRGLRVAVRLAQDDGNPPDLEYIAKAMLEAGWVTEGHREVLNALLDEQTAAIEKTLAEAKGKGADKCEVLS